MPSVALINNDMLPLPSWATKWVEGWLLSVERSWIHSSPPTPPAPWNVPERSVPQTKEGNKELSAPNPCSAHPNRDLS